MSRHPWGALPRALPPPAMALTQTAEYALRAVVWLAHHPGEPQTTRQIADATQVPSSYLPKVLHPLVRAGLVNGQRGLRGGYSLLREPHDLTLLEVVDHVDPLQRIESCPLGLAGHRGRLCPLHRLLDELVVTERRLLGATRISALIAVAGQAASLCGTLPAPERGQTAAGLDARSDGARAAQQGEEHTAGNGPTGPAPNAQHSPPPTSNPT